MRGAQPPLRNVHVHKRHSFTWGRHRQASPKPLIQAWREAEGKQGRLEQDSGRARIQGSSAGVTLSSQFKLQSFSHRQGPSILVGKKPGTN